MSKNFPPGWLALMALGISITLFLIIIFGTFVRLRSFAGGLDPFDGRATGYSTEDARQLLEALGETGRSYYRNVQLWIDTLYPASYGISRSLALLWLTRPGRALKGGVGTGIRIGLGLLPFIVMMFDYVENYGISLMLSAFPDVPADTVAWASRVSTIKSMLGAAVEILILALLAAAVARWLRARRAAGV